MAIREKESKDIDDANPYLKDSEEKFTGHAGFYEKNVKRIIDKTLSFLGLIVFSPVYVLITVLVFTTDPGPIFFKQKRVGQGGCYFMLHKFRSMKMSAPYDVPTHELRDPEQYITKVGRVLRKTSLDELPQIWDIFRGKMSIVGPRPALWNQYDLVAERGNWDANNIRPGLTGLAQIKGRDELSIKEKAKLDGQYRKVLQQGGFEAFLFDLKIFFGSITPVLRRDGVVEGRTKRLQ